jgi:ornithine cyclodeaminase/alanine dehydrogenase-like protein (mu-crystallin family)
MSLLILDRQAVAQALPMHECIEVMATALADFARGAYSQFPRHALRCPQTPALMGLMPVFKDGEAPLWGLKDVLVSAGNRALSLDSHQGAMLVHDGRTGTLQAMLDASELTLIRTAATSAVATRALARTGAAQVAILGTGAQARAHIAALRLVLPDAKFTLWGRSSEHAQALASSTQVTACEHARERGGRCRCDLHADSLHVAAVAARVAAARLPCQCRRRQLARGA